MKTTSLLFLAVLLPWAGPAAQHTFTIDSFTVAGGGGSSTGGVFAVSGTIGQSDANPLPLTGGDFSLTAGFWSPDTVPTSVAPFLSLYLTSTNTAIVSWLSPSIGFTLQQTAGLNSSDWVAASETVTDNGTNRFIIVNPPTGNRFFRLFKP